MEIWKDVKGYEELYQVSTLGRVWSVRSQKCLKPQKGTDGRLYVNLYAKNGKQKKEKIHRLVDIAFIDNANGLPQVNHKDENPTNNSVDNLEWCDSKYNCNYGTRNKRVSEKHGKKVYCIELDKTFESISEGAKAVGRKLSALSMCLNGNSKTCGGYHWRYT